MADPGYRIDSDDREIVVRLRRDVLDPEEVSRFLDFLELETIRRRSQLSETDVEQIVDEVDQRVWAALQSKVDIEQ